ncbi:pyocin knob domain-containing protein [Acinetobacter variabilis]|uniref:pyocin knob domain-containing protein n=1 Tax=Acinetobacter variabilis TaxID=70346 RepID=UPI0035D461EC
MAKQTVNPGTAPTGAGGDTFRSGSAKLQANDDELYSQLGATAQGVLPAALPISKGGTGATTATAARTNLGLGSAATLNAGKSDKDMVPTVRDTFLYQGDLSGVGNLNDLDDRDSLAVVGVWTCTSSATPTLDKNFPEAGIGGSLLVAGSTYGVSQLYLGRNGIIHFRNSSSSTSGSFLPWAKQYSTRNTTVDSNGFIKSASPIIELYADRIELNDEAQLQGITFEKLAVGDYLIKGSSGFAQEGWYVETPKDANGNVLFSVIYTTLENGDISVKTYKKKFDLETASIVADLDNPVDITENRWIDLRLQELPQPEIEMPESIAPPDFQPTGLAQAVATVMESYHDSEQ